MSETFVMSVIYHAILDFPNHLTNDQLDSWRGWSNIFLVGANAVVWLGVYLERERFSALTKEIGWACVVIGVGLETLAAFLLWQVDGAIITRQGSTISDIAGKAKAAKDNAKTALDNAKDAEGKIADLIGKETRLRAALDIDEKARRAMLEQEKPRTLTAAQIKIISDALKGKFKEITVTSLCDQDAISFANAISEAVRASGASPMLLVRPGNRWCWNEWSVPASLQSVTVYESGSDIMGAFIKAKVYPGDMHSPNEQFEAEHIPTPTIFVGQKPIPFQKFPEYALPKKFKEWEKKHPAPWEK